jgi:hypothetical protein
MNVVSIYVRLYLACLRRTAASIGKSPWTLLLPMGLLAANLLALGLTAQLGLGLLGGFIASAILAALGSCYLYFLGELNGNARVGLAEFGKSIRTYFWSVVNVLFVYWIASLLLSWVLERSAQAAAAEIALRLVALVLLNAVPEVIYQRGTYGGLATMKRAIQFLQACWLEWSVPNLVLLGGLFFTARAAFGALAGLGYTGVLVASVLVGGLFHGIMVFRGHLFAALDGTSHRQRMFRYRTTG